MKGYIKNGWIMFAISKEIIPIFTGGEMFPEGQPKYYLKNRKSDRASQHEWNGGTPFTISKQSYLISEINKLIVPTKEEVKLILKQHKKSPSFIVYARPVILDAITKEDYYSELTIYFPYCAKANKIEFMYSL